MICPRKIFALGVLVSCAALLGKGAIPAPASFAASQQASPPPAPPQGAATDQQGRIVVPVRLVVVPVTVKDATGALVGDVRQDEFRVFDNGVEQRISVFSNDAVPLSAILLIDEGMKPKTAQQVQKSLVALAGGFSATDEAALATFDSFYTPALDFTMDPDRLVTELKRVDLSSSEAGVGQTIGATGSPINVQQMPGTAPGAPEPVRVTARKRIDDAVYAAAEDLRGRDPNRRKLIILVSNGVNAKNNTHSYDQTLKLLLSSDISVYSVGVDMPLVTRKLSVLSQYAHATGGDVYYASDQATLSRIYSQVGEQSRHQYTLGYTPRGSDKPGYHPIEVRIRRAGLELMTRDGYYSLPNP